MITLFVLNVLLTGAIVSLPILAILVWRGKVVDVFRYFGLHSEEDNA